MISTQATSILCLGLAEMLHAGMTVGESFLALYEQESDEIIRDALYSVYENTISGGCMAEAVEKTGVFPEYMVRMLRVAEKTGALESVLRELSAYYDRQTATKRAVRSAVVYPILLLVIVLAVFFVFLTEVLPIFNNVFHQIGADMPRLATVFLNVGVWLAGAKWWILAVLIAIAGVALLVSAVPALRNHVGAAVRRSFSKGKTGRKISAARTASVLSLCFSGAKDIGEAMELVSEFATGFENEDQLSDCQKKIASGVSFSQAMGEADMFEPFYCRMISIGERTGSVDTMMRNVACRTQKDMENALDQLVSRVEPVSAIVLTLCVGLLLLSVMLPLVGIMSAL